ncbi:hypothetical protein BCR44DRAFT_1442348 [Catenaria anguillulae PL171]|uniref:Uncharacterized protein n=1 Tax=Catenaria anguillulae PL171 TaxID=765915 RepID=A0A1Y2HBS4_9FUNG|nr:hypothetical protein BCR44DRAFT_1442348 [Catenaria anguillulae PL171]
MLRCKKGTLKGCVYIERGEHGRAGLGLSSPAGQSRRLWRLNHIALSAILITACSNREASKEGLGRTAVYTWKEGMQRWLNGSAP